MSRQPPLPPGPPPRGSGPSAPYGGDSYRPQSDYDYRPPHTESYRPQKSPPVYEFRGYDRRDRDDRRDERRSTDYHHSSSSYAPGTGPPGDDAYRHREDSFSFRFAPPPSIDMSRRDFYRPRSPPRQTQHSRDIQNNRRLYNDENARYPDNQRSTGRQPSDIKRTRGSSYNNRGRRDTRASARAFLQTNRAPTPELMPGFEEENGKNITYKKIEDMSDSDESDMDLSDDDDNENESEQPKKKQVRTEAKATDGDNVPQWSNPDPYTALPPPDESQRKKKDVVKLIRKARVISVSENATKSEAVPDDFISFDFDEDETSDDHKPADEAGPGVPGAPTGPRPSVAGAPTGPRASQITESTRSADLLRSGITKHNLPPKPASVQNKLPNKPSSKPSANIDLTSDPALGSRKRTIRDEIKGPPKIWDTHKGKKGPSDGSIVKLWTVKADTPSTPWIEIDHSHSANMGVWLHKEIVDFYNYVKPRNFEQTIRTKLVEELRKHIKRYRYDSDIFSFGSFPAGLYLPTADMDIVMLSGQFKRDREPATSRNQIWKFSQFLEREDLNIPGTVEVIPSAKVPLVKYVDKITGLRVDISFDNNTGLIANDTFQEWKAQFPAMPILVTLIKHLLAMRGLNEPVNGGIGGFSVICLVVSLLQHMPQVQSGTMIPEHHLGEILMEFLDLYGNQFNTTTTAISLNPPQYMSKSQVRNVAYKGRKDKFSIIDPNRSDNDISGGSDNTPKILECFSNAYRDLQKRMGDLLSNPDRQKQSILGCILAGDYSSFELQRDHLAHIHEKLVGPIEDI